MDFHARWWRAKWGAWDARRGLTSSAAREQYVTESADSAHTGCSYYPSKQVQKAALFRLLTHLLLTLLLFTC